MSSKKSTKSTRRVRPMRQPYLYQRKYQMVLLDLIDTVPKSLNDTVPWIPDQVRDDSLMALAGGLTDFTQKEFGEQIVSILGAVPLYQVDTSELVQLFVRENMILVEGVPKTLRDTIESTILRGARSGAHVRQIEKEIATHVGLAKKRAKLIARDQVNKLSGDLTKHHHKAAGINHYRWMTSRDERVRSRHANLDGQIFSWSKPPIADKSGARFHPKQAINCRCDAIPVIEKGYAVWDA